VRPRSEGRYQGCSETADKRCSEQPRHRQDERHTLRPAPVQERDRCVSSLPRVHYHSGSLRPALRALRCSRPFFRTPPALVSVFRRPSRPRCRLRAGCAPEGARLVRIDQPHRTAVTPPEGSKRAVEPPDGVKRVDAVGGVGCLVGREHEEMRWFSRRGDSAEGLGRLFLRRPSGPGRGAGSAKPWLPR
jgi:hypothetical protein